MAIDSHMHINRLYVKNCEAAIKNININPKIEKVINVGICVDTSKEVIAISDKNPKFYSAIGIHPTALYDPNCDELYELANNDKVVAIGEIGLDTHGYEFEKQKEYLIKQIIIANELKLPVIIHANNTNSEVIEVFKKYEKPKYGCVFHCFQPDFESLKYIIDNGHYISFAGRITYQTAKKSIEIAKIVPNDLFLVETDSPFISPEPRRNKVNESAYIKYIIAKLAEVKGLYYDDIEKMTTENAKRLFKKLQN